MLRWVSCWDEEATGSTMTSVTWPGIQGYNATLALERRRREMLCAGARMGHHFME